MLTQILSVPSVQILNSFNAKNIVNRITKLLGETIRLYSSDNGYHETLISCNNAINVSVEHLNPSIPFNEHERIFKIKYGEMAFGKIELKQKSGSFRVCLNLYGTWPVSDYKLSDFFDSLEIAVMKEFVTNPF